MKRVLPYTQLSVLLAVCGIAAYAQDGTFFEKPHRTAVNMVVDGFLYINAEDFSDYGGWRMDTQFVHLMGSPYLMATGIGTPVEDATTTFNNPEADTYHVWVRARNWIKDYAPGRFQVKINQAPLDKEFGAADTDQWTWEYGGAVELDKGPVALALHDLTGYYGRCDAILLTTDATYTPPECSNAVCEERARLLGLSIEPALAGDFDVIVVGGGPAGTPAAIAAARMGAKTALIQNRPTLGGNASVECGVGLQGAGWHHPGWRETGIIEEAGRIRMARGEHHYSYAFQELCEDEENLSVFFNQHVFDAVMENEEQISSVKAVSTLTGAITEYHGTLFIDCTGDGWVGYFAGAEYRYGREARSEFGESLAPEEADDITMSGCLMGDGLGNLTAFRAEKTDEPVPFTRPPWAREITTLVSPGRNFSSFERGLWWMEHPGDIDNIWEAEEARDELIKVTFSYWDYIKNRSRVKEEATNYTLVTIPIMNAKRESRRLEGDYMMTQHDCEDGRMFLDRIAHTGWPMDIHHVEGIYSGAEGSFDFQTDVPIGSVPFRSLYSKNISNLMMAGRCGSFSRVALGTVRVMSTLAAIGQAAGTAAAMCTAKEVTPRDIYQTHILELQQTLLKYDQTIPGMKNRDANDLARSASITASSTLSQDVMNLDAITMTTPIPLNMTRSVILPTSDLERLDIVALFFDSAAPESRQLTVHIDGLKDARQIDGSTTFGIWPVKVAANSSGWVRLPVDIEIPADIAFLRFRLPQTAGISWPIMSKSYFDGGRTYGEGETMTYRAGEFYAIATTPVISDAIYEPENVVNGWTRLKENPASLWASDPEAALPQWLELDFGKATEFNAVYLTFDTELNTQISGAAYPKECVKGYTLSFWRDGEWAPLVEETDNYQRHRIHRFAPVTSPKLRLTIHATHGFPSARVYEIRAYKEVEGTPAACEGDLDEGEPNEGEADEGEPAAGRGESDEDEPDEDDLAANGGEPDEDEPGEAGGCCRSNTMSVDHAKRYVGGWLL